MQGRGGRPDDGREGRGVRRGPTGRGRALAPGSGASAGVGGERRGRVGRGGATGEERVGIWGEKAG